MPKGIFKRHLDISSVLLIVIQVPLLTTFGLLGPLKNLTLFITGRTKATRPQTCSSALSEVNNNPEEVTVIQLLSHISAY